jgi:hypothetical protein
MQLRTVGLLADAAGGIFFPPALATHAWTDGSCNDRRQQNVSGERQDAMEKKYDAMCDPNATTLGDAQASPANAQIGAISFLRRYPSADLLLSEGA